MGEILSPLLLQRYPLVEPGTWLITRPWAQWLSLLGGTVVEMAGSSGGMSSVLGTLTTQAVRDLEAALLAVQAQTIRSTQTVSEQANPFFWLADPTVVGLEARVRALEAQVLGLLTLTRREPTPTEPPWWCARDAVNSVLWNGQRHETGTFTATGTGFTVNPTGTARWVRLGNQITLFVPTLSGTSNATTFTVTGLPVALQPTQTSFVVCMGTDNGTPLATRILRLQAGSVTMDLFPTAALGAWAAAGTKTLNALWLAYAQL